MVVGSKRRKQKQEQKGNPRKTTIKNRNPQLQPRAGKIHGEAWKGEKTGHCQEGGEEYARIVEREERGEKKKKTARQNVPSSNQTPGAV